MRIYLAISTLLKLPPSILEGADILCSYYYLRHNQDIVNNIPKMRDFLCDSGLFTMINSKAKVDIESYMCEYADFVRANNIREYIELDVDQIIGVSETRKLRDRLEKRVGWPSIPVWHTIRGRDSFTADAKEYDRICLGYFLTEGLSTETTERCAPWFIDEAHRNGCRIHGLGFTKTALLPRLHFDSVDSSSWSAGHRYGSCHFFDLDKKVMRQVSKPAGKRAKTYEIARHNYLEWRKYQDWARNYLPVVW